MRNFMSGILALLLCLTLVVFILYIRSDSLTITLACIPSFLIILSMFLQNRLAKVQRAPSNDYEMAIIPFLLRKYPGIIRHNCSQHIIIITTPPRSFYNKEFLILQDGQDIYMNISLYGQGRLKYLFLTIPQYFTCKSVLKDFRRLAKA